MTLFLLFYFWSTLTTLYFSSGCYILFGWDSLKHYWLSHLKEYFGITVNAWLQRLAQDWWKFNLIPFVYVTLWRNYEMTTHFFRESPAAHYRCFPYGKGKVGPFPLHSSVFSHRGRNLQRQQGCKWHHTEASGSTYCQGRSWFSLSGQEYPPLQPTDGKHLDSSASCFTSVWHRNPGVSGQEKPE